MHEQHERRLFWDLVTAPSAILLAHLGGWFANADGVLIKQRMSTCQIQGSSNSSDSAFKGSPGSDVSVNNRSDERGRGGAGRAVVGALPRWGDMCVLPTRPT